MAFGKRVTPPKVNGEAGAVSLVGGQGQGAGRPGLPVPVVASTMDSRCEDLRQTMVRLLNESGRIASAIRDNGSIAMPGMDESVDPLGPPLSVRGFNEHFTGLVDGGRVNTVFAYVGGARLQTINPEAQEDLQSLIGAVQNFNRYCQQALLDDALGVALQAPKLPPLVDRIIAGAAHFAAFFDAVAIARPAFTAQPAQALSSADQSRISDSYQRHHLMAIDRMLAPDDLSGLLPRGRSARIGIETTWSPHTGEQYINGVYFPAEQARTVVAAGAPAEISAFAAAV